RDHALVDPRHNVGRNGRLAMTGEREANCDDEQAAFLECGGHAAALYQKQRSHGDRTPDHAAIVCSNSLIAAMTCAPCAFSGKVKTPFGVNRTCGLSLMSCSSLLGSTFAFWVSFITPRAPSRTMDTTPICCAYCFTRPNSRRVSTFAGSAPNRSRISLRIASRRSSVVAAA